MTELESPLFEGRYRRVRTLGEGAQGTVELVQDSHLGDRLVAIKTLRPRATDDWLRAFKHEFEVLAGLSHPRLAAVHDFGTTGDGRVFFTRDYIAGDDLKAATTGASLGAVIETGVEVCRALKPLHQRGLMHGDLKPGNIIVGGGGIAHLIDFSFVRATGDDAITGGTGTVQYMAPEVIEGRAADVRADLYALGATLFEILAGRPPFDGTVSEIIAAHLGDARPELQGLSQGADSAKARQTLPALRQLLHRLLARDPDDRLPDVGEVEAALVALAPGAIPEDPVPFQPVLPTAAGRDHELRRVRDAVGGLLEGSVEGPALVSVEGELGSGKEGIVRGTKWWCQLRDNQVVESRCEGGGGLLDPVAILVRQALALPALDDSAKAIGERTLESLSRPTTDRGAGLDGLAMETGRLLARVGGAGPLLVIVHDVDQASAESLKLLRGTLAVAAEAAPIAMLATGEADFDWEGKLGRSERVSLSLLEAEQVEELVRSFFGRADQSGVERILAHTGGNPLFVSTLLQDLAATDGGLERLEKLGAPRRLEAYWRDRLTLLSADERVVLHAAAVLDGPADLERLAQVAEVEVRELEPVLDRLESAGWLRETGGRWHVATRPLTREVIAAAPEVEIETLHRRAVADEPDEARQLLHAAACGELELVRGRGLEVAGKLERLGALDAAAELLAAMGNALESGPEAAQVELALGRIGMARGDYEAAGGHLEPLGALDGDPALRRQALLLLGRLHALRRELPEAADQLNSALEIDGDAGDTARILLERANVEALAGQLAEAAQTAERGLDDAPTKDPVRADLLGALAKFAVYEGRHDEALARCRSAVAAARESRDLRARALATNMLSWVRQQAGDLTGAIEDLEQAVSLNREIGDLPRLIRAQMVLADLYWWTERWPEMLANYEEAARLAGAVGNPVQQLEVRIGFGHALGKVGRFERAALMLEQAREDAERLGIEERRLWALTFLGDLDAWQGRFERAVERWSEARAGLESLGLEGVAAELELEIAEVRLWRRGPGDVEAAAELVERAEKRDREDRGRGFDDLLELVRAVLTAALGRFDEAILMLDELADRLEHDGPRDLAWQAHLAAAREMVERGSDVLARKRLRQAGKILDALAADLPPEHRLAFWQDVRRAEVRRLLAVTVPSSGISVAEAGADPTATEGLDPEAQALYRVLDFNKRLSTETDIDRLFEAILDSAVELTGAERGFVLMPGDAGLEVRAAREIGRGDAQDPHEQFSRSIAESVLLDGEPVVTVDASGDERFNEFLSIHELRIRSVACIPVTYRNQALGVLYLENRLRRGRFGRRDLRVLGAFSDQVAIAISQARLLDEARTRQAELEDTTRALEELCARQKEDIKTRGADLKLARQRLERIQQRIEGQGDYRGLIGTGSKMLQVFEVIERVKDLDVPVVLYGESGTGKDLLARVIHDAGERRRGPFVTVACGGMPETLVEATLFGHEKGAFSGADDHRPGLLAAATGGTLYLDDIGEMPPRMQVDLLRVLQEGCYVPLGGHTSIRAEFRLLASSRLPLDGLVETGRLRRDLFYRLQVLTIELPPLCERAEDIPALARRIIARESGRLGQPDRGLSAGAIDALMAHAWPGNVRELEQLIRRALVISDGSGQLDAAQLFGGGSVPSAPDAAPRRGRPPASMDSGEERRILEALERCQWNRSKAAQELGIPRRTFYRRLKKLGLMRKQ